MQLRCPGNKVHGEIIGEAFGTLEVFCDSRWCGKRPGNVVLHRIDLLTGEFETRLFKKPTKTPTEVSNAVN